MNLLSNKIGLWASVFLTISLLTWIICFIGISLTSPIFIWTNLSDYLMFEKSNSQFLQTIAKSCMLLFGPIYVLYISSFYNYTQDKKILVSLSSMFGLAFALLSSTNYFVQLSSVRINITQGNIAGIEHFLQANPYSIISSINMLGWTLFLGLSSFLISAIFNNDLKSNLLRNTFIVNGISCFIAGIGYILDIKILIFIFINLGVGGALMTICISSIKLFLRLKNETLLNNTI